MKYDMCVIEYGCFYSVVFGGAVHKRGKLKETNLSKPKIVMIIGSVFAMQILVL